MNPLDHLEHALIFETLNSYVDDLIIDIAIFVIISMNKLHQTKADTFEVFHTGKVGEEKTFLVRPLLFMSDIQEQDHKRIRESEV